MTSRVTFILLIVFTGVCSQQVKADPCASIHLPEQIRQELSTHFPSWRTVTVADFDEYDRQVLVSCCSKECPGVITGKFVGEEEGYVLNLIRKTGGRSFQQVVYFRQTANGFVTVTVCPSSRADVTLLVRRGPPGKYRDVLTGKSIKAETDVIILSQIEAAAIAYYWDGTRFQKIIISE